MGYEFRSPAAKKIYTSLPAIQPSGEFFDVFSRGGEAVYDWARTLVLKLENAILSIGFQRQDKDPFLRARQTFLSSVYEYYRKPRVGREAFGQVPAGERAEEIIDVFNELATLSHELIESREKLLKEKAPQSLPDFYARVATVVEQFEPLVRLGQGTATVAEAEYRGGKPDEALLHDIIAAENPGVLGEPGARPDKIEVLLAGHRLPKGGPPVGGPEGPPVRLEEPPVRLEEPPVRLEEPPVRLEEPPMRPPEGPPEPGRFHE